MVSTSCSSYELYRAKLTSRDQCYYKTKYDNLSKKTSFHLQCGTVVVTRRPTTFNQQQKEERKMKISRQLEAVAKSDCRFRVCVKLLGLKKIGFRRIWERFSKLGVI